VSTVAARLEEIATWAYQLDEVADPIARLQQLSVFHGDVRMLEPPTDLPPGTVVYLDPPYAGCTGYGVQLPREAVLELALRWQAAGAQVYVSEAEPLPLPGWYQLEISHLRRRLPAGWGRKREFLTMSHAPASTVEGPLLQTAMFPAGKRGSR